MPCAYTSRFIRARAFCYAFPLIVFVFPGLARAEWAPIIRDSDVASRRFSLFVDPNSIVRRGEQVTVRVLLNMREKTEEGVASVIAIDEYDCVRDLMRSKSIASYAERGGKGRVIREYKSLGPWVPVEPGKINEAVLQNVCDFYPNWWSE